MIRSPFYGTLVVAGFLHSDNSKCHCFETLHQPQGVRLTFLPGGPAVHLVKGKIKGIYTKELLDRENLYKCLSLSFSDQHAF